MHYTGYGLRGRCTKSDVISYKALYHINSPLAETQSHTIHMQGCLPPLQIVLTGDLLQIAPIMEKYRKWFTSTAPSPVTPLTIINYMKTAKCKKHS